jgi:stage II sporulation protein R
MGSLVRDKYQLSDKVLRLHVVANSDSQKDQTIKLRVRDAILDEAQQLTMGSIDKVQACEKIREGLKHLENVANEVLDELEIADRAKVTLTREEFGLRQYDTFSLPAGVYDSLRVTIGEGQGKNWWCVIFPSLCIPAASDTAADTAAGAGFSDSLTGAVTGDDGYEVRFFFLDVLGKLENFFHIG